MAEDQMTKAPDPIMGKRMPAAQHTTPLPHRSCFIACLCLWLRGEDSTQPGKQVGTANVAGAPDTLER